MLYKATQDRCVIVKSSDKTWSTGGGKGKPLQYSSLETTMDSMKRQEDMTSDDESPRSEGIQYAIGEEWRTNTNSPRKNEVAGPKWKQCSDMDMSGDENKIRCYKVQYCIGTWNVRSMHQGKLDMVKQGMVRISIDILGISELKWTWVPTPKTLTLYWINY